MEDRINALFSTKELVAKNAQAQAKVIKSFHFSEEQMQHEFFLNDGYKAFAQQLPVIQQNETYHFISLGNWSLKHVVFHVLSLIGKAEIYSTTYGLGPKTARGIVQAIEKGMISNFHFLYDNKIKTYKEEAHNICVSNFPVQIVSIHAKVTVLINDEWSVVIGGSSNWSDTNDKIEYNTVFVSKKLADFHKDWILRVIAAGYSEPTKIYHEVFAN